MRCCAHILNLIVGDGIREIDASIAKVLEVVRYVKFSQNRNQIFMGFVERLGIESKSLLCLDVPTRWNSTYLMLKTTQNFEKVFIQMDFEGGIYSSYFMNKENSGGMDLLVVLISKIVGHCGFFEAFLQCNEKFFRFFVCYCKHLF